MIPVDMLTARKLLDLSGGKEELEGLGKLQLEGAVALQNHLADPDVGLGYLADEVGMGKTYIALATVALMRYFNPMLRVLYLCPSRNVQEKWVREYQAFVRGNVKVSLGRIRTRDGKPAVPYASCRNVEELIRMAASGYYADFFIGKDSFSLHLDDRQETWQDKLAGLRKLVPAWEWKGLVKDKMTVKEQYARVLNYILPTFDLVVIDEAHNFKRGFESSDRNRVLSRVLGFSGEGHTRAMRALLLSATPYDRDINQLRNQLLLVGKGHLLPGPEQDTERDAIRASLKRFMVRRLNLLTVNGERLTRNRYRREWRKGERAEISLESDEQKLIMALVQKKVGEMLSHQTESPSFQAGLLASFESFAESARSEPVRFDGEQAEKSQADARDRHVLGHIVDSYVANGLGRTLPHPKMDVVVQRLCQAMFQEGKKQIVFVRRVRSVNEIKAKLDDGYSAWLYRHICRELEGHPDAARLLARIYEAFQAASNQRDDTLVAGELEASDEPDKALPPKNDTLFAWFFRGETLPDIQEILGGWPTPERIRIGLTAKNQVNIALLEHNWAAWLCGKLGIDLTETLIHHGSQISRYADRYFHSTLKDDYLALFQSCQAGFVSWLVETRGKSFLQPLVALIAEVEHEDAPEVITEDVLARQLKTWTLYSALQRWPKLDAALNPWQERLYQALAAEGDTAEIGKLYLIHNAMAGFLLRTGHGIVDVYLARLKQGMGDLNLESRGRWMDDLASMLEAQSSSPVFSTYHDLERLASHLELIVRNNIPEILDEPRENHRRLLSRILNPVSPIIGASGETGDRSPQARKFRMPGYPLALVSTDVFQEGEDLHTFCDSVVHYGISASPVSLEQKSGRVDRVNSLAQRRLQALARQTADEDYIQITFPFVRESIESLQIRSVCRNINEYLLSLHDFGDGNLRPSDMLALDTALLDRGEIPEQIMAQLHSPYDAMVVEEGEYGTAQEVERQRVARELTIEHLSGLIDRVMAAYPEGHGQRIESDVDWHGVNSGLAVCLKSAKASGELLLSLTRPNDPDTVFPGSSKELIQLMDRLSWRTFHRTVAVELDGRHHGYRLYANSEMLVGGEDLTDLSEVQRLFERMDRDHDPENYSPILPEEVMALLQSMNENTGVTIDRHGATQLRVHKGDGVWQIGFHFGGAHQHRTHKVLLYECAGRCVFLSRVTADGFARRLSVDDLIRHTWLRNRQVDLVEFLANPKGAIMGRVVHPLGSLQWEEFIYCAYTLAVETDNLEYILSQVDQY